MIIVARGPTLPYTATAVHKPLESNEKANGSWGVADYLKYMIYSVLSSLNPNWTITQKAREKLKQLVIMVEAGVEPKKAAMIVHALGSVKGAAEQFGRLSETSARLTAEKQGQERRSKSQETQAHWKLRIAIDNARKKLEGAVDGLIDACTPLSDTEELP
ncbi:MAG: hypothetical protein ACHQT8_01895 [Chlamydiales bacterium]